MNNKAVLSSILIFVLGISLGAYIVYASTDSTVYITTGIYPDGDFIVYEENSLWYAKTKYGLIPTWAYGVSNETTLCNTVLSSLTNGRTWKEKVILTGNLEITSNLNVQSHTEIEIRGKLKATGDNITGILKIYESHDVEIHGGEIQGKYIDQSQGGCIWVGGTSSNSVYDLHIHDMILRDALVGGIWIADYCHDVIIHDIQIYNIRYGITTYNTNNEGYNLGISNINYYTDIPTGDRGRWAVTLDRGWIGASVANVQAFGAGAFAIASCQDITGNNLVSINASFTSGWRGINIETTDGYIITKDVTLNNVVVKNAGSSGHPYGIWINDCESVTLSNFVVYNCSAQGIMFACDKQNITSVTLLNGIVEYNNRTGLAFSELGTTFYRDILITNVVARNNGQENPDNYDGIALVGNNADTGNIIITSCRMYDDQGSKTQRYGLYLDTNLQNHRILILGNDLVGNSVGTNNTWTPGANDVFEHNIIT